MGILKLCYQVINLTYCFIPLQRKLRFCNTNTTLTNSYVADKNNL